MFSFWPTSPTVSFCDHNTRSDVKYSKCSICESSSTGSKGCSVAGDSNKKLSLPFHIGGVRKKMQHSPQLTCATKECHHQRFRSLQAMTICLEPDICPLGWSCQTKTMANLFAKFGTKWYEELVWFLRFRSFIKIPDLKMVSGDQLTDRAEPRGQEVFRGLLDVLFCAG